MLAFGPNIARLVLAALLSLALPVLAGAAASPVHGHSGAAPDSCAICSAGHVPFAAGAALPDIGPPLPADAEPVPAPQIDAKSVAQVHADGRAPPLS